MRGFILYTAALSTVLLIGGCYEKDSDAYLAPPDYSPDYAYIKLVSEDGRTRRVLVPEACLRSDERSPADAGPQRLPPGCANNYNLERMVERKSDLTRGRPLSPAPGAPSARAAQNYIDGKKDRPLGGGVNENAYRGKQEAVTEEPQ
jgi:hypothetical protein